jgi:hypothetical protein
MKYHIIWIEMSHFNMKSKIYTWDVNSLCCDLFKNEQIIKIYLNKRIKTYFKYCYLFCARPLSQVAKLLTFRQKYKKAFWFKFRNRDRIYFIFVSFLLCTAYCSEQSWGEYCIAVYNCSGPKLFRTARIEKLHNCSQFIRIQARFNGFSLSLYASTQFLTLRMGEIDLLFAILANPSWSGKQKIRGLFFSYSTKISRKERTLFEHSSPKVRHCD